MNRIITILVLITLGVLTTSKIMANQSSSKGVGGPQFIYISNETAEFTAMHKKRIERKTLKVIARVKESFPTLSDEITFNFKMIDRDLTFVGGVSGRADRASSLEIIFSDSYPGGVDKAIEDSLEVTLFHEIHHIVRGWLVLENKFGHGIDIATINEGLADAYSELEAGHPHATYSDSPDFDAWTKEILALPVAAHGQYGEWMFQHPDGRQAIGYRTGAWIVKKAMSASGKDIVELTQMSVNDIYDLAGYRFRKEG